MTARTRTEALCLEAAERDMRALVTWSEIDRLAQKIGHLSGVTHFDQPPGPISRKVAVLTVSLPSCGLCKQHLQQCECDPDASWAATYAAFKRDHGIDADALGRAL